MKNGLVEWAEDLSFGRTVPLRLTGEGRKLYKALMTSALERDKVFRSCLSADELASFRAALRKLEIVALALAELTPKPRNI